MIPGLDMLRLFIKRILNKRNPFKADQNHLHHLLYFRFKPSLALIAYCTISFSPIIISYFVNKEFLALIILISTISYFLIIKRLETFRN